MTLAHGVLQMPLGVLMVVQARQRLFQLSALFGVCHGNRGRQESFTVITLNATPGEDSCLVENIIFKQRGVRRASAAARKRDVIRIAIPEAALVYHVGLVSQ
jgi:hypothetical protein